MRLAQHGAALTLPGRGMQALFTNCNVLKAKLCAGEGQEVRMRELCADLMGPVRLGSSGAAPTQLGMHTRALLRDEVLKIMGANRSHQRLVNDFLDQLRECE